ncbi:class I SAM-dependent methyltransferase [uncultured Roseibium sp.]|uniref:class I SAM-dependent methyltransferase n=1 Tax=uncultured Roseibium sp. TaxID=1936171 RepID=UPI002626CDF3|nr:class I SAM-dependent methyltransferase [uncultured Roseibium sp.]
MTLDTHAPHIPVFKRHLGSWQIAVSRQGLANDQLRRAYDDCAPSWERTIERLGFPLAYRQVLRQLVPNLKRHRESPVKVLDCGVGTGAMALALAAEMDSAFELSAVDISPVMLEEANSRFERMGINCQLQVADIRALPYASESFDLVMCAHAVEHLEVPQAAISEMYRVLKPGGTLLVVTTRKTLFGAFIHLKWRTHRLTSSTLRQWLKQNGLSDLETMPVGTGRWTRLWSTAVSGRKQLPALCVAQDNAPCALPCSA